MNGKIIMTALDTFHASNVHSENLQEGHVFFASDADAKAFEARGLAKRGGKAAAAVNASENRRPGRYPETREEIDAEREGKAIRGAPRNKAIGSAPAMKSARRR